MHVSGAEVIQLLTVMEHCGHEQQLHGVRGRWLGDEFCLPKRVRIGPVVIEWRTVGSGIWHMKKREAVTSPICYNGSVFWVKKCGQERCTCERAPLLCLFSGLSAAAISSVHHFILPIRGLLQFLILSPAASGNLAHMMMLQIPENNWRCVLELMATLFYCQDIFSHVFRWQYSTVVAWKPERACSLRILLISKSHLFQKPTITQMWRVTLNGT